jgi:hypothetical protein
VGVTVTPQVVKERRMTEAEWLVCDKPEQMLLALQDWASERRFRLFTCACLRRIWHLLAAGAQREAILLAEKYTDEERDKERVTSAGRAADEERDKEREMSAGRAAWETPDYFWSNVCYDLTYGNGWTAASRVENVLAKHPMCSRDERRIEHLALIRCIFGNPFRSAVLNSSWLTSTVRSLARGISTENAFSAVPILADALQDAGCANEDILNHCRSEGLHGRGCWVLDLLLDNE